MENTIAEYIARGDKLIDLTNMFAFSITHDMTDDDLKRALFYTLNNARFNDSKDNTFKENG